MIPRDGALLKLEQFLCQHAMNGRIRGMTINTLMKMARLVLDTNCFISENKSLSTNSWWSNGITIYNDFSQYIHVRMGTIIN